MTISSTPRAPNLTFSLHADPKCCHLDPRRRHPNPTGHQEPPARAEAPPASPVQPGWPRCPLVGNTNFPAPILFGLSWSASVALIEGRGHPGFFRRRKFERSSSPGSRAALGLTLAPRTQTLISLSLQGPSPGETGGLIPACGTNSPHNPSPGKRFRGAGWTKALDLVVRWDPLGALPSLMSLKALRSSALRWLRSLSGRRAAPDNASFAAKRAGGEETEHPRCSAMANKGIQREKERGIVQKPLAQGRNSSWRVLTAEPGSKAISRAG
ncbi:uncharacterized protein LOC128854276 [Cuculus canorus]|uniref:uncharacterized protein LOC128854276 n=1 Tax=Cuculus canorus TaxID=55661 RepID=UPI0023AABCEF|nr:uncharacterized protein LOC128854276 [Cuculus canorus]